MRYQVLKKVLNFRFEDENKKRKRQVYEVIGGGFVRFLFISVYERGL